LIRWYAGSTLIRGRRRYIVKSSIQRETRGKIECHIVGVETSFPKPAQGLVSTTALNAAKRKPLQKSRAVAV
jgi:hypothetical protein